MGFVVYDVRCEFLPLGFAVGDIDILVGASIGEECAFRIVRIQFCISSAGFLYVNFGPEYS